VRFCVCWRGKTASSAVSCSVPPSSFLAWRRHSGSKGPDLQGCLTSIFKAPKHRTPESLVPSATPLDPPKAVSLFGMRHFAITSCTTAQGNSLLGERP